MTLITRLRNSRFFRSGRKESILVLSFIVGLLSGLVAVLLKNAVHLTDSLLRNNFNEFGANWLFLLYPLFGILLAVLFVRFVVKDQISHGITRILFAISRQDSVLKRHNIWSSFIASTATVGFGGSVGLEAPVVLTGSALGSRIGRFFRLNYKTLTLLVGCGATGAVAGIFKAPIAGVGFALEVLLLDMTLGSLVPLMISAVTAASVAYFLMGDQVLFSFTLGDVFLVHHLPWYILLGIFTGLVSVYFGRGMKLVEGRMLRLGQSWKKWLVGGVALAILIYLFPPLYGEGYDALRKLLTNESSLILSESWFYPGADKPIILLGFIFMIILLKVVATAVTTGAGGIGGIFAPSLFLGGFTGYFVVRFLNLVGDLSLPVPPFVLVGMAGVMSGVMHAPLTAMFLLAEITGGYNLLIPLMLTAAVSYVTSRSIEPHSIYTKKLAERGDLITHNKDKAALTRMRIRGLIETDFAMVKPDQTLRELVKVVSLSNRNVFPVVDDEQRFLGLIIMENLRQIMFETEKYDNTLCSDLMYSPEHLVYLDDTMEEVAGKFQASGKFNMVVLEGEKYVGCVSRARVFSTYRDILKEFSED